MRRLAVLVGVFLIAMAAPAASATWATFGKGNAKGTYPMVTLASEISRPTALRAITEYTGRGKIEVSWSVTCVRGNGSPRTREGAKNVDSGTKTKLPVTVSNPDACDVMVTAIPVRENSKGNLLLHVQRQ